MSRIPAILIRRHFRRCFPRSCALTVMSFAISLSAISLFATAVFSTSTARATPRGGNRNGGCIEFAGDR